jgi:hypothetical protein
VRGALSEVRLHEQLYANGRRGGEMITRIMLTIAIWLDLCAVAWFHSEVTKVGRKYNESEKGS